ncbi:hypothetical protein FMIA91_10880 [Fidelibacter multiformis]
MGSIPSAQKQLMICHDLKMLGCDGLNFPYEILNLSHAVLFPIQDPEDLDSCRMPQNLEG